MPQIAAVTGRRLLAGRPIREPDAAFAGRRHVTGRNGNLAFMVVRPSVRLDHDNAVRGTRGEKKAKDCNACRNTLDLHEWHLKEVCAQRISASLADRPAGSYGIWPHLLEGGNVVLQDLTPMFYLFRF